MGHGIYGVLIIIIITEINRYSLSRSLFYVHYGIAFQLDMM